MVQIHLNLSISLLFRTECNAASYRLEKVDFCQNSKTKYFLQPRIKNHRHGKIWPSISLPGIRPCRDRMDDEVLGATFGCYCDLRYVVVENTCFTVGHKPNFRRLSEEVYCKVLFYVPNFRIFHHKAAVIGHSIIFHLQLFDPRHCNERLLHGTTESPVQHALPPSCRENQEIRKSRNRENGNVIAGYYLAHNLIIMIPSSSVKAGSTEIKITPTCYSLDFF